MKRPILSLGIATAVCLCLPAVAADTVYSWTDAEGVVHFSDNPPAESASASSEVETLRMPVAWSEAPDPGEDYYSISNQWQRLQEARDRRDALALQRKQARINAYRTREEARPVTSGERVAPPAPAYLLPYGGHPGYHRPRSSGHSRSGVSFEYQRSLGQGDGYRFGFRFGNRHGRQHRHADKLPEPPRQRQFYVGGQSDSGAGRSRKGSSSGYSLGPRRD